MLWWDHRRAVYIFILPRWSPLTALGREKREGLFPKHTSHSKTYTQFIHILVIQLIEECLVYNCCSKNQIIVKNLGIVAQCWTLSKGHMLRLYFCVFQCSIIVTSPNFLLHNLLLTVVLVTILAAVAKLWECLSFCEVFHGAALGNKAPRLRTHRESNTKVCRYVQDG